MRLPSMTALRALDAIARLGSVSSAADELDLTRSAISHQISSLEDNLGFGLTERQGRGIALTVAGERYARDIHRILASLEEAGRAVDNLGAAGRLTVSCNPGFASYWLCQHIGDFARQFPQVQLHLIAPRCPNDVSDTDADMFITYGNGDWPNMQVEQLLPLRYFPVCSPRLSNAQGGLKTLEDLSRFTLLHMGDHSDWRVWLTAAKARHLDLEQHSGVIFTDANCAQAACLAGQGVAMGDNLISGDALAQGLLVRPFDIAVDSMRGYFLVSTPEKHQRPTVEAFSHWLKHQLKASTQRWRKAPI